ncbi:MAG: glycosyltransferase family 25 protein, partial [Parachlamydiaceae bacterium]|nr:glycosyltransferase family 25 protein [Parachlamydiaceae bacterium]
LSHVSAIKDAYEHGFNAVWIFEDDIEFTEDPHHMSPLIKKLNFLDPSWDILYTDVDSKNSLGETIQALASDFRPDRSDNLPLVYYLFKARISNDFNILRQRYGLYSYILSRKGMKKIYDYFTHVHLWTAIDIDIHYIPKIRQYSTVRDIVSIWCYSPFSDTKQN